MQHYLVPQHDSGHSVNLEHEVIAADVEEAEDWFVTAKDRLLDVNHWRVTGSLLTQDLHLTDSHGRVMNRHARKGDHIRINIPGPGPREVDAYDWVVIAAIEYDDYPDESRETFALKICAAGMPGEGGAGSAPSGTLVIERNSKMLRARYHGRNVVEYSFVPGPASPADDSGQFSAWLGISDAQWQSLLTGMIE